MSLANVAVVPSYPAPDWISLERAFRSLIDVVSEFQVDIVDGQFVPAVSWPFIDEGTFANLKPFTREFAIEMDCMVCEPLQYLDTFVSLGIKRVVIHKNSTNDYQSCINHGKVHGYQVGMAVLPTEYLDDITELIAAFDYVQVMGIREVGKQGQPFAPEALELITAIRAAFPEKTIAVDGAVNAETIPTLLQAGANRLAPGSAIIAAEKPAEAYRELCTLVDKHQ